MTKSERLQQVLKVIQSLGLQNCANTRVGGDELKGISGGEKRRLSVAVQLLAASSTSPRLG
jgi:ABC-type multidrug transport system ATPase subunit